MGRRETGHENKEWGKIAEDIAADYLRKNGYTVLDQNWRAGKTIEIDLIAEKESTIIFVEVKARKGDYLLPDEAIDMAKLKKMVKGGDIYMQQFEEPREYRMDIITILGTPESYELQHLEDAFLPPLS